MDSFTYTITDADGSTSSATVTLNVGAVDDARGRGRHPVGVTEDTPFTASLASNDTPSGDGGNVWSKTTDPANGTVTVTAAGVFTYTPNANFNGVDSFTYTITDADGSTSRATVTLNVGAVNDVPRGRGRHPGASPRTRRLPPAWPPTTRPRAMAAMSGARPPIRPTAPSP
ncbi:MAG: tandem-95 repeat protein [Rhodoferax sp.]|nr:tandem-95 repeat protein [Rhodoferax sp.]